MTAPLTSAERNARKETSAPHCNERDSNPRISPLAAPHVWDFEDMLYRTCDSCGEHFPSHGEYIAHMEELHPDDPRGPLHGFARPPKHIPEGARGMVEQNSVTFRTWMLKQAIIGGPFTQWDERESRKWVRHGDAGLGVPCYIYGPEYLPANRFRITRLIRKTNKAGLQYANQVTKAPDLNTAAFPVNWGDFLLDLSDDLSVAEPLVRNIHGDEVRIPRHMLQSIHLPWGLQEDIPLDKTGDLLPLALCAKFGAAKNAGTLDVVDEDGWTILEIESSEWVFVRRGGRLGRGFPGSPGGLNRAGVVDFEGNEGWVSERSLVRPWPRPWGLLVNRQWLGEWLGRKESSIEVPTPDVPNPSAASAQLGSHRQIDLVKGKKGPGRLSPIHEAAEEEEGGGEQSE